MKTYPQACKELSKQEFIQRLIEAGWTKNEATKEWNNIQNDEENDL